MKTNGKPAPRRFVVKMPATDFQAAGGSFLRFYVLEVVFRHQRAAENCAGSPQGAHKMTTAL
jgi:hypothetical protein